MRSKLAEERHTVCPGDHLQGLLGAAALKENDWHVISLLLWAGLEVSGVRAWSTTCVEGGRSGYQACSEDGESDVNL
jgi:hypothetical protein